MNLLRRLLHPNFEVTQTGDGVAVIEDAEADNGWLGTKSIAAAPVADVSMASAGRTMLSSSVTIAPCFSSTVKHTTSV
jgi:hypothetical protein